MPIFEITNDDLVAVAATTFGAEGIYERDDIQRLLRKSIHALDEQLMVIAEEFRDWLDSSRSIDLLCLDNDANLVVVELKRTEDGGHMELQALRYAAMVSAMTFGQLVETHARFLSPTQPDIEASKAAILEFLGWDEVYEDQFGRDTRIVLAAADFGKELTTAVMWLNDRGIDVRCVRLKPYKMAQGPVLLDIQQLIPLPEAASFQTQIGVKKQAVRQNRTARHELRYRFWETLLDYAKGQTDLHANRSAGDGGFISGSIGRAGFGLLYATRQTDSQVELWIGFGPGQAVKNKAAFQALLTQKDSIEASFGGPLDWQELPESDGCRIRYVVDGGYRSPADQWPMIHQNLTSAMIRLDKAMRGPVSTLP